MHISKQLKTGRTYIYFTLTLAAPTFTSYKHTHMANSSHLFIIAHVKVETEQLT